jgi:NAD(P)-dependent dehydrogenase (short-subunit alcohol dehydrogenase family)
VEKGVGEEMDTRSKRGEGFCERFLVGDREGFVPTVRVDVRDGFGTNKLLKRAPGRPAKDDDPLPAGAEEGVEGVQAPSEPPAGGRALAVTLGVFGVVDPDDEERRRGGCGRREGRVIVEPEIPAQQEEGTGVHREVRQVLSEIRSGTGTGCTRKQPGRTLERIMEGETERRPVAIMAQTRKAVAWIVGASSGIGAALALELARHGWRVALSGRRAELLEEVRGRLPDSALGLVLPLDVVRPEAFEDAAERLWRAWGPPDAVFLNAGIYEPLRDLRIDPEEFRRVWEVNYMGVVNGLAALVPRMAQAVELRRRQILVTSSLAGFRGLPQAEAYGPTKAALINLAEALRARLEQQGVEIRVIAPGFVATPMTARNRFPMPFLISAEDAARRIRQALDGRRFLIAFPWPLSLIVRSLRFLPDRLYFVLLRRLGAGSRSSSASR